jgi:hypothetical protein
LRRWDSSTLDAMRRTGVPIDPDATLGQNLGNNFSPGIPIRGGAVPGTSINSIPLQPGQTAAPPLPPPTTVNDRPVFSIDNGATPAAVPGQVNPIMDAITKLTTADPNGKASPLGALANTFSQGQQQQQSQPDNIIQTGALQSSDSLDMSRMANAQQLMQSLIAKNKARTMPTPGFGMTGMMG